MGDNSRKEAEYLGNSGQGKQQESLENELSVFLDRVLQSSQSS